MTKLPRELRKQRCIMTTDSEWEMITGRARRAGMTNSRFIVERILQAVERQPAVAESADAPPVLRPGVQQRMALAMLVLARIEEQRLRDTGGTALWDRLVAEETEYLDCEDLLPGEARHG
ncbi:MAG: hypothetical protein OXF88_03705 [Rhodobacteraceae bacterium]|nr:hypothetical protein [Paracoccaceae bacterium]MCY4137027.1 hypothetical protein [Paracoccaceae bacterium]